MRLWPILFVVLISSCSKPEEKLTIACAANLEIAVDSIAQIFSEKNDIAYELVSGASGVLSTQIEASAPFDVFVSADTAYTYNLYRKDFCSEPVQFAEGHLIIVYDADFVFEKLKLDSLLLSDQIQKIAIPDPDVAPFGRSALNVIESHVQIDLIEDKIVMGENVSMINGYIESKSVDLAFTSNSYIEHVSNEDYRVIEIMQDSIFKEHILQSAVAIKQNNEIKKVATSFIEFLESDESSKILEYFGYSLPD